MNDKNDVERRQTHKATSFFCIHHHSHHEYRGTSQRNKNVFIVNELHDLVPLFVDETLLKHHEILFFLFFFIMLKNLQSVFKGVKVVKKYKISFIHSFFFYF